MVEETLMDYLTKYCSSNIDLDSYVRITKVIKQWFKEQVQELEEISKNPLHRTPIDIICNRNIIKWLRRKIPLEGEYIDER